MLRPHSVAVQDCEIQTYQDGDEKNGDKDEVSHFVQDRLRGRLFDIASHGPGYDEQGGRSQDENGANAVDISQECGLGEVLSCSGRSVVPSNMCMKKRRSYTSAKKAS